MTRIEKNDFKIYVAPSYSNGRTIKIQHTTMKSSFAPIIKILREELVNKGTGSDAFNFLRSNNGILELSFINF